MSLHWQWNPETNENVAFDPRTGQWISQAEYFRSAYPPQILTERAPIDYGQNWQSGQRSSFHGPSAMQADGSTHVGVQAYQPSSWWSQGNDTTNAGSFSHQMNGLSLVDKPSAQPASVYHNAIDNAGVRSTTRTGPAHEITDPELLEEGVSAHKQLCETEEDVEKLFPGFRKRKKPAEFFKFGKVFQSLWAEPAGETIVTSRARPASISKSRFGEDVHSKIRRFVVIKPGNRSCSALPITTYQGKGVAKGGVTKSHHSVIYTGKDPPDIRPNEGPQIAGELPIQSIPIRVIPDEKTESLDPMSRLDYSKVYTVEHYVKVQPLGVIHEPHKRFLLAQFNNVWSATLSLPVEAESARNEPTINSPRADGPEIDRETLVHALMRRGYSRDEAIDILDAKQPQPEDRKSVEIPAKNEKAESVAQGDRFSLSPANSRAGSSTQQQPRVTSNEAQVRTQKEKDDAAYQILRDKGMSARQASAVIGKRRQ